MEPVEQDSFGFCLYQGTGIRCTAASIWVRPSLALGTRWKECFPVLMPSPTLFEVKKDPEEAKNIIFISSDLAEVRGSQPTKISP